MSQENVEVVQRHLEAWNQRDKAAYVTSFRPDAEIDWSRARALYRGVYRGREQQKAFWEVFWSTWEDSHLEIHDLTEAGSDVVVGEHRSHAGARRDRSDCEKRSRVHRRARRDHLPSPVP